MKSSLIIISLFSVSISIQAATPTLKGCAAIENPDERLACYDTLAGRLSADTVKSNDATPKVVDSVASKVDIIVPAAPAVTPVDPAVEPAPDAEAIFGLEHKQKEKQPDELQLKWTKKMQDAYGKWIIFMENGQVWRQTDTAVFSFNNPEQRVVISRGALGSFFLVEPEGSRRIRVMRAK
ncbi:MAG: hypothetical protein GX654_03155 [Desulfatiglans sp.]|nr:hypothetical protein [Desulfatiglans sp.]